jgi:uncharacterized protein (TIGR00269 family)
MKCRRCSEKAAINMRQHKLALCKDHYLEWLPEQVERAIKKYKMFTRDERILVAVSGGKDSLSLWDILHRLGYLADGLYISLVIDGGFSYSAESQRLTEKFAQDRGLLLHIEDLFQHYGATLPDLAARTHRGRGKPCSVCGLSKRHIMNQVAYTGSYAVLATGHNLDDEAAVLFGNSLTWNGSYLVRQAPVLPSDQPGLARKVKPLCRIYEREMAAYAILSRIEYIYDECPFAIGSTSIYYKELLNKLEYDRPGAKLNFYLSFLQAKEDGLFSPTADRDISSIHACPTCGQPTTAPGECAFCRMFNR